LTSKANTKEIEPC